MTKQFIQGLANTLKQDIINIDHAEFDNYIKIDNGNRTWYVVATSGGYSVVYCPVYDEIAIVFCLNYSRGDWSCGTYYNSNHQGGCVDYNNLYDWEKIATAFTAKALGVKI